jgi:hypothetical protein
LTGQHDSVIKELEDKAVSQAVPLDEYKAHLRFFLESLTSSDSPYAAAHEPGLNIVLITPGPLCLRQMAQSPYPIDRHPDVTKPYADAVLELGQEYKAKETPEGNWRVATINMWDCVLEAAGEGRSDPDEGLPVYLRWVSCGKDEDSS